jgi:hypothetical protein
MAKETFLLARGLVERGRPHYTTARERATTGNSERKKKPPMRARTGGFFPVRACARLNHAAAPSLRAQRLIGDRANGPVPAATHHLHRAVADPVRSGNGRGTIFAIDRAVEPELLVSPLQRRHPDAPLA